MADDEKIGFEEFLGEGSEGNRVTLETMLAELGDLLEDNGHGEDCSVPDAEPLSDEETALRLYEDLNVDLRWANKFEDGGVITVGDLFGRNIEDLLGIKGIGATAIAELERGLSDRNLPTLHTLSYYEALPRVMNTVPQDMPYRFRPFPTGIEIDYLEGPDRFISLDGWVQHTIAELPFLPKNRELSLEAFDEVPVREIPELYESLPYPQNEFLGKEEPVSTLLFSSLEHLITDFGYRAVSRVVDIILEQVYRVDHIETVLECYAEEVKRSIQPELLPTPIEWLISSLDPELKRYGTVDGLLGSNKSFLSVYIAHSFSSSLQRLTSITKIPYKIGAFFTDTFIELNSDCDTRAIEIFIMRNGLGMPRKTPEETGNELGVTRERIRQIESMTMERFNPLRSERLLLLRLAIFSIAKRAGAIGSVDALQASLASSGIIDEGEDCLGLLEMLPEFEINRQEGLYTLVGYPCATCEIAAKEIDSLIANSSFTTHDEFIGSIGCESCGLESEPILSVFDKRGSLRVAEDLIGAAEHPVMRAALKPNSERALLHAVLYEAGKALTYDEMIDEIFKRTGNRPSKSKIGSQAGSFSDCMLWGRGAYIHERNAPYPRELLSIISDLVVEVFAVNHIPIVGVEGIYSEFQDQLQAQGIPTHHALYSLLRKYGDKRLALREYPWICDVENIGDRTSFAKYFYSVLEDNNGFITDAHAKVIAEKTMAQSFALGGLAEYSPFVINANGGWYDVEAAGFDMEGIASLAEEIAAKMRDNDIVSAVRVFEDHRERCFKYGVKSYDMLYYLVDMMEDNLPIEATRKPHFVKSNHKGLSAVAVMRMYIKDAPKPVSKDELYEEFITKRRLKLRGICGSLLVDKDVIEVGNGRYWSREKLSLGSSFIDSINSVLASQITKVASRKVSKLFYPRKVVIPNLSALPQPSGVSWNSVLLRTALTQSHEFRLFGEDGSCVVDLRENPDVVDTESFFRAVLDNEFYGWTSFDQFAAFCKAHSIHSGIEPEFFDAFSTIEADEGSIQVI